MRARRAALDRTLVKYANGLCLWTYRLVSGPR